MAVLVVKSNRCRIDGVSPGPRISVAISNGAVRVSGGGNISTKAWQGNSVCFRTPSCLAGFRGKTLISGEDGLYRVSGPATDDVFRIDSAGRVSFSAGIIDPFRDLICAVETTSADMISTTNQVRLTPFPNGAFRNRVRARLRSDTYVSRKGAVPAGVYVLLQIDTDKQYPFGSYVFERLGNG